MSILAGEPGSTVLIVETVTPVLLTYGAHGHGAVAFDPSSPTFSTAGRGLLLLLLLLLRLVVLVLLTLIIDLGC